MSNSWSMLWVFSLVGCAAPQAVEAPPSAPDSVEGEDAMADNSSSTTSEGTDRDGVKPSEAEGANSEPSFAPGMSVDEAQAAVPETIERLNIEQEALAAPLMEPTLYEPCELEGHHHFKLKVAVWNGRAVGVDVTTEPNDVKLESCLRKQVGEVTWRDKAKSMNTVEYSY